MYGADAAFCQIISTAYWFIDAMDAQVRHSWRHYPTVTRPTHVAEMICKGQIPLRYPARESARELVRELVCDLLASC